MMIFTYVVITKKNNDTTPSFTHFALVGISLLREAKPVDGGEVWHGKRRRTKMSEQFEVHADT